MRAYMAASEYYYYYYLYCNNRKVGFAVVPFGQ